MLKLDRHTIRWAYIRQFQCKHSSNRGQRSVYTEKLKADTSQEFTVTLFEVTSNMKKVLVEQNFIVVEDSK